MASSLASGLVLNEKCSMGRCVVSTLRPALSARWLISRFTVGDGTSTWSVVVVVHRGVRCPAAGGSGGRGERFAAAHRRLEGLARAPRHRGEHVRVRRDLRDDREELVHLPGARTLEGFVRAFERLRVRGALREKALGLRGGHLGDVVRGDHLAEHGDRRGRKSLGASSFADAEVHDEAADERAQALGELRVRRGLGGHRDTHRSAGVGVVP